jgi:hypothetical protein
MRRPRLPPGWPFLAVAVAAGLGAIAFFVPRIGSAFDSGCVPADFPAYPGLRVQQQYRDLGGSAEQCNVVWQVDADGATVRDFYSRELQRGDWELVESGTNPLAFRRHSQADATGSLAISTGRPTALILYLRMPKP